MIHMAGHEAARLGGFRRNSHLATGAMTVLVVVVALTARGCNRGSQKSDGPASDSTPQGQISVTPIVDLGKYPPASGGGTLLAALQCQPDGTSFPKGYTATWNLPRKMEADTVLWIVEYDQARKRWCGTRELAYVSADGLTASGTLYHFSDHAVQDAPPASWSVHCRFVTEWIWLLANYSYEMDKLARAVSRKYGSELKLGPQAYLPPQEMMSDARAVRVADNTVEIGGLTADNTFVTIEDEAALQRARAKFRQKKDAYEAAFDKSFSHWLQATTQGNDAVSVAAIWNAVADLRVLQRVWKSERTLINDFWGEIGRFARKELVGKVTSAYHSVLLKTMKLTPGWIAKNIVKYEFDQAWATRWREGFEAFFDGPKGGDASGLITILTDWGDASIHALAWPNVKFEVDPGTDPRQIGGFEEFYTGPAMQASQGAIMRRQFGEPSVNCRIKAPPEEQIDPSSTRYRNVELRLDDTKMRSLVDSGKIRVEYMWNGQAIDAVVAVGYIDGYRDLEAKFKQIDKDISDRMLKGVDQWTQVVKGPDRVKAAAAMRLYTKDLQKIVADEKSSGGYIKAGAGHVLGWVGRASPFYLKPLIGGVKWMIGAKVDEKTPRGQLLDVLEEQSILSATAIVPTPTVEPVFPDRIADLAKLMSLDDDSQSDTYALTQIELVDPKDGKLTSTIKTQPYYHSTVCTLTAKQVLCDISFFNFNDNKRLLNAVTKWEFEVPREFTRPHDTADGRWTNGQTAATPKIKLIGSLVSSDVGKLPTQVMFNACTSAKIANDPVPHAAAYVFLDSSNTDGQIFKYDTSAARVGAFNSALSKKVVMEYSLVMQHLHSDAPSDTLPLLITVSSGLGEQCKLRLVYRRGQPPMKLP